MMRLICVFLLSAACSVSLRAEEAGPVAHKDPEIGVVFPRKLGGLTFEKVATYEDPGAGYSLRYEGAGLMKVDVYVYTKALDEIPSGYDTDLVKAESQEIVRVLEIMQKRGAYTDLKHLDHGMVPGTVKIGYVWDQFEYRQLKDEAGGTPRISESFVTAYAGRLFKVRLTYLKSELKAGRKVSLALVSDLARVIETAKAAPSCPSEDEVLKAIGVFRADPVGEGAADAARLIFRFAEKAETVTVVVSGEVCPWILDKGCKYGELLFVAYVAGNIEPQLKAGRKGDQAYEGALQTICTYKQLRALADSKEIPSVEKWVALQKSGELRAVIEEQAKRAAVSGGDPAAEGKR